MTTAAPAPDAGSVATLVLLPTGTTAAAFPSHAGRDGRAGRRHRPGLPADPLNPWTRTVTTWGEALREPDPEKLNRGKPRAAADGTAAEGTRALHLRHVGWLAGDHSGMEPWDLTPADLAAWLDGQNWSVNTRRKVVGSVRAFYAWAVRADLCQASPLAGVSLTSPERPGPRRVELPEAWREPVATWQVWLRAGARMESTLRTYSDRLQTLAHLHADPWAVTEGDLGRWLAQADLSPAHKRGRRATARSFYAWATRTGRTSTDPTTALDPIRLRRALPRPAPTSVLRDALECADARVTLALQIAIYAGLRRAEIATLHTRDIHEDALHVVGKGGHERKVPLHPDLATALRTELLRRSEERPASGWPVMPAVDGWLFPSSADPDQHLSPRWLGRIVTRALAPGWTPHTIRHRFATQAYVAQRDLRAVQELLGHSKPETTARYAAVPDGALATAVGSVGL